MEGELQHDKVFVRGLRFGVETGDVAGAFAEYGLVDIVRIDIGRTAGQSLASNSGCVAYVQFMSAHSASAALALDGNWSIMLGDRLHVKTCIRRGGMQQAVSSWRPEAVPPTRPLWRSAAWVPPPTIAPLTPKLPPPVGPTPPRCPPPYAAPLTPVTAHLLAPDPVALTPAPPLYSPPERLGGPVAEGTTHVPRPPMQPPSPRKPTQPPLESLARAVAEVLKKEVLCRSHEHCL